MDQICCGKPMYVKVKSEGDRYIPEYAVCQECGKKVNMNQIKLGKAFESYQNESLYLLMDLERTIGSGGHVHYWKPNRHGYTRDITEAGIFDEPIARAIVDQDFDKRTIMIPFKVADRILKNV